MLFYDSHLHLMEMKAKEMDPVLTINRAKEIGLISFIDAGVDEQDLVERQQLADDLGSYFSIGIHPNEVSKIEKQWKHFETYIPNPRMVAVGEIGLDYFRNYVDKKVQQKAFIYQLQLADKNNLPVLIHNRDSMNDIKEILSDYAPSKGGIIHCYSGNADDLDFFISRGFYISFACNLTYKKNHTLHEAASQTPSDRLLIETDAPYLSPRTKRGKLNTPENLPELISFLASLKESNELEISGLLKTNFNNFIEMAKS